MSVKTADDDYIVCRGGLSSGWQMLLCFVAIQFYRFLPLRFLIKTNVVGLARLYLN